MRRIFNFIRTLLLLASLPAILLLTIMLITAGFWLILILCAAAFDWHGHILLPALFTFTPQGWWHHLPIPSAAETLSLPVGASFWPVGMWDFIYTAAQHAVIVSAPYAAGAALLWLLWGWRYQQKWVSTMAPLVQLQRQHAPQIFAWRDELCAAANLPPPGISIMHSAAPNAFASGLGKSTYTITLTTKLLEILTPREIKAVMAHELGHIHNGDVRLLTFCFVYIGIFNTIAAYGWSYTYHSLVGTRTTHNKFFFSVPFIALAAACCSIAATLADFVRLVLLRERELGADAFSAKITQDPAALASALDKISSHKAPLKGAKVLKEIVIYRPLQTWWQRLTCTHPTLEARFKALGVARRTGN